MDLNLYFRVIARFRVLVIGGVLLAACLAFFSYARVSAHGLSYRQPKEFASHDQLLVTQNGFPLGQATVSPGVQPPGNLTTTAVLYSSLAQSGVVRAMMLRHGPVHGIIQANAEATADGSLLPIIDIAGIATSPADATATLRAGTQALRDYVRQQQIANKTAQSNRIIFQSMSVVGPPVLLKSPSITRPIFVFLAVLMAVLGLAFILENLRPRVRMHSADSPTKRDATVAHPESAVAASQGQRRSS
jgi:hypothetical protein